MAENQPEFVNLNSTPVSIFDADGMSIRVWPWRDRASYPDRRTVVTGEHYRRFTGGQNAALAPKPVEKTFRREDAVADSASEGHGDPRQDDAADPSADESGPADPAPVEGGYMGEVEAHPLGDWLTGASVDPGLTADEIAGVSDVIDAAYTGSPPSPETVSRVMASPNANDVATQAINKLREEHGVGNARAAYPSAKMLKEVAKAQGVQGYASMKRRDLYIAIITSKMSANALYAALNAVIQ